MVELLAYLAANGFSNYIVSGGGRDFMRPISQEVYGIPRQRVIGSTAALAYTSDERGGTITHKPEADYLDDGPEKPIRIWSRTGRRPLLAAGNSNGDVPMLHFTQHRDKPFLRLLVLHDDDEREFAYTTGAEQALDQAAGDGWTVDQRQGRLGHRLLIPLTAGRLSPRRLGRRSRRPTECGPGRPRCAAQPPCLRPSKPHARTAELRTQLRTIGRCRTCRP